MGRNYNYLIILFMERAKPASSSALFADPTTYIDMLNKQSGGHRRTLRSHLSSLVLFNFLRVLILRAQVSWGLFA